VCAGMWEVCVWGVQVWTGAEGQCAIPGRTPENLLSAVRLNADPITFSSLIPSGGRWVGL